MLMTVVLLAKLSSKVLSHSEKFVWTCKGAESVTLEKDGNYYFQPSTLQTSAILIMCRLSICVSVESVKREYGDKMDEPRIT